MTSSSLLFIICFQIVQLEKNLKNLEEAKASLDDLNKFYSNKIEVMTSQIASDCHAASICRLIRMKWPIYNPLSMSCNYRFRVEVVKVTRCLLKSMNAESKLKRN